MLNHEHKPTGQWRTEKGKSEANCSECGWYETTLVEKTSPTPLTVKEIIENIVSGVAEYPHGRLALAVDLRDQLESLVTTLTTQHTKEKEELVREIMGLKREFWEDYDHAVGGYISRKDIKEIAKNHNITI